MTAPVSRPTSDVSAGVGLSGLAGLALWVMICRSWGPIADALALPGPHEPLAGPNAAMAALLFSGTPMVLWSLLVDKVHLRASTGIDWKAPRPLRDIVDISITKVAGLWATWSILGFIYCLCRWYWRGQYLFAMDVLTGSRARCCSYLHDSLMCCGWTGCMVNPRDASWHFGAMLVGREAYDRAEVAHHMRAWAVKGFFCAFMFSILPGGFENIVTLDYRAVLGDPIALGNATVETHVPRRRADRDGRLSADHEAARCADPQRQPLSGGLGCGADLLSAVHPDGRRRCARLPHQWLGMDVLAAGPCKRCNVDMGGCAGRC